MQRRTVLRKAGAGSAAFLATGLTGCTELGGSALIETPTESPPTSNKTGQPADSQEETQEGYTVQEYGIPPYDFTTGESYTYHDTSRDSDITQTWEVDSVNGNEVTVNLETEDGEQEPKTVTVSGTRETIYDEVGAATESNPFPFLRASLYYATRSDMTQGDSFTIDVSDTGSPWDSETVEVIGEKTINGVTGTQFKMVPNSDFNQVTTTCVNPEYPFGLRHHTTKDGEVALDIQLIELNRP